MRQVLNKSMIVMAAASGILTAAGGYAHADASADGAAVGSPGVGSGNAVQVPVHVPVNLCGNTVDVIALLNPAFGNACANVSSDEGHDGGGSGSGAQAEAVAADSPGVLSGNAVQAPIDIPVNACGNSVNVVGLLNPVFGNDCVNDSGPAHHHPPVKPPTEEPPTEQPPTEEPPTVVPPTEEPPAEEPPAEQPPAETPAPNTPDTQLAETGAGGVGMAAGASAALLLGGAVLMRRTRATRG
ncbi:MAG TPA: peptidase [Streptomyces sp.]|uniref:Chaplin n=1 Tax=Streptomyces salyersiae TaxID=3075530 RepID=A0ABU2RV20_9ACTN|nr:chaplin [Streptomyces sp. DSM 41770]MDT0432680.1 chaplin [Streptomyces sp. DSM 41770]HBF80364.1 peptidase [Streptomyces sp.]